MSSNLASILSNSQKLSSFYYVVKFIHFRNNFIIRNKKVLQAKI